MIGNLPATLLPREITTPGEGQIRALLRVGRQPGRCRFPTATRSRSALEQLDLMVSLDLYVNETNRHADYVLPATTFLEREDVPVALLGLLLDAVHQVDRAGGASRAGEARQEWEVIDELSRRDRRRAVQPAGAAPAGAAWHADHARAG